MDSLKIISDINSHLTTLDAKVEKTSKSASLAFSYLYGKIEQVDDCVSTVKTLNEKVTNICDDVEKTSLYSYSYYTSLKSNIAELTLSDNTISSDLEDEIKKINERFEKIDNQINNINEKLNKIIDCPEKFIVVKQEPPIIIMFFKRIYNWLYRIFHAKQIREEQERIAAEEKRKQEEELEKKRLEELEKQRKQEQEKLDKQKRIKNLLKK